MRKVVQMTHCELYLGGAVGMHMIKPVTMKEWKPLLHNYLQSP